MKIGCWGLVLAQNPMFSLLNVLFCRDRSLDFEKNIKNRRKNITSLIFKYVLYDYM